MTRWASEHPFLSSVLLFGYMIGVAKVMSFVGERFDTSVAIFVFCALGAVFMYFCFVIFFAIIKAFN